MAAPSRAAESSVRNLGALYSVMVGVALAFAAERVVDSTAPDPIQWNLLPLLGALVATLIPFYHGALRHLDVTYVEQGGKDVRAGALLADFLLLFLEGSVFMVMAGLVTRPEVFVWAFAVLLFLDAVWGLAAHFAFSRHPVLNAELRWAYLNLVVGTLFVLFLIAVGAFPPGVAPSTAGLDVSVLLIAVLRTAIDYALSWGFYVT